MLKIGILVLLVFSLGVPNMPADGDSIALEKLLQIPPAPPNVEGLPLKHIPVVIVKAQGVFINDSKTPVPFGHILEALANLPRSSWPYGRAIIFWRSPPSVHQANQEPPPAASEKVEAELKKAEIHFMENEVST